MDETRIRHLRALAREGDAQASDALAKVARRDGRPALIVDALHGIEPSFDRFQEALIALEVAEARGEPIEHALEALASWPDDMRTAPPRWSGRERLPACASAVSAVRVAWPTNTPDALARLIDTARPRQLHLQLSADGIEPWLRARELSTVRDLSVAAQSPWDAALRLDEVGHRSPSLRSLRWSGLIVLGEVLAWLAADEGPRTLEALALDALWWDGRDPGQREAFDAAATRLADAEHLRSVRRLTLAGSASEPAVAARILGTPLASNAETVDLTVRTNRRRPVRLTMPPTATRVWLRECTPHREMLEAIADRGVALEGFGLVATHLEHAVVYQDGRVDPHFAATLLVRTGPFHTPAFAALRELDLSGNRFCRTGAWRLTLLPCLERLEALNLDGCRFPDGQSGLVTEILGQCPNLRRLSLRRVQGGSGIGEFVEAVASASLEALALDGLPLGVADATALGWQAQSGSLRDLSLARTDTDAERLAALLWSLGTCPTLRHLGLRDNPLDDRAVDVLDAWVAKRGRLERLDLRGIAGLSAHRKRIRRLAVRVLGA